MPSPQLSDLQYVQKRLKLAFKRRSVLPYHALLYRLTEVGQNRFDMRKLGMVINALAEIPDGLIRRDSLFFHPAIGDGDLEQRVAEAKVILSNIATTADATTLTSAAAQIKRLVKNAHIYPSTIQASPTLLTSTIKVERPSLFLHLRRRKSLSVLCWLSNELSWIYPDDPRLWSLLDESTKVASIPLIVARKVAPVTFPLLKAVGAFALQYYLPLSSKENRDLFDRASLLGWPRMIPVMHLAEQPIVARLLSFMEHPADAAPNYNEPKATKAVQDAVVNGFTSNITRDALVSWSEAVGLLPKGWIESVVDWTDSEGAETTGRASSISAENGLPWEPSWTDSPNPSERTSTVVRQYHRAAPIDPNTWNTLLLSRSRNHRSHRVRSGS